MNKKKKVLKIQDFNDITPFLILAVILIVFAFTTGGKIFRPSTIAVIVDQSITTLIAGMGMIFVIALGGTDISAGGIVAMAGFSSYLLGCRYGSLVAFLIAIAIGLISGTLLGIVNAKFKVPSFMASLALGIIALRGLSNVILSGMKSEVIVTQEILAINKMAFKLPVVAVLVIIITYIFHFTPFGYNIRAIGENEVAVKYSGVNVTKTKIIAFIISGIMGGLAAVFTVSRAAGVQSTLGTGFELNIMLAIFVAGVPVRGGMGAKIYKLFIGAFSMILLQTGMVLSGLSGAIIQGVTGVILLVIVYLTAMLNAKDSITIGFKKTKEIKSNEEAIE